jgi:uncharacterized Zn finger protein
MMKKVKCGSCGGSIEVSQEVLDKDNYIQCPLCGAINENPYSYNKK